MSITRGSRGPGAALLALALAAGCGSHAAEDTGEAPDAVVTVRTVAVERRVFEQAVTAPGQWRSSGDVVVAAPFPAYVESLGPRVGDAVRAGETVGRLVTRESRAGLRGAELLVAEAQDPPAREEARRALALARRELVRVPLVAPRGGDVTRRSAEPGAEVADGAELLVITPTAARVFEAHVPAGVPVRAGMRATLALEGEPAREGVVQRVLPAAGAGDQSVLVWIAPTGPGGVPALERAGTATVRLGSRHAALAVPEAAIAEDDLTGEHQVAAVDDSSRARWIPVTTGGAQEGWREIRGDAVRPGMRVILEGQHGLPDHTRVKPGP